MKQITMVRSAWVLLAAGTVIAATWTLNRPYDPARELDAQAAAAKGQAPAPGAEALLRRSIAAPPREPLPPGTDITRMGPLTSITYLGSIKSIPLPGLGRRIDNFRATYRNGALVWRIAPARDGAPPIVFYFDPKPQTPQQTMERYSAPSRVPSVVVVAIQLGLLLVFAFVGRFVLRIRL